MQQRLDEANRSELLNKSKHADIVKSYGTTRYERRTKQHVVNSVSAFNKIDMNALFRANLLSFKIPIKGETDTYEVEVLFEGICDSINTYLKQNNNKFEYKCVYRALIHAINSRDILIACTCPDFKYRISFYATKGGYNGGYPEIRPSKITNPDDTKGAGCKHIMNVLANLDWALKLASTIVNYITYMADKYPDKYQKVIVPAIYNMSYDDAVKKGILTDEESKLADTMDNEEDKQDIDDANAKAASKLDRMKQAEEPEVQEEEPEQVEADQETV